MLNKKALTHSFRQTVLHLDKAYTLLPPVLYVIHTFTGQCVIRLSTFSSPLKAFRWKQKNVYSNPPCWRSCDYITHAPSQSQLWRCYGCVSNAGWKILVQVEIRSNQMTRLSLMWSIGWARKKSSPVWLSFFMTYFLFISGGGVS